MGPCTCGMRSGNGSIHSWYEVWEWVHTPVVWGLEIGFQITCLLMIMYVCLLCSESGSS